MYTAEWVCSEFNVSKWTLYSWRKKGVLPPPIGGRRYARYTDDHLRVIRAIKKVVHDERVTIADLAERLYGIPAGTGGSDIDQSQRSHPDL